MGANAPGLADRIGFEPVLRKWRGRGVRWREGKLHISWAQLICNFSTPVRYVRQGQCFGAEAKP